jgi:hypothetical protein
MNTIITQNQDGTFTVFDADQTITAYDGSQQPAPIFTGTLSGAQNNLSDRNSTLSNAQNQATEAQAIVDAITSFDPITAAEQIANFKKNLVNPQTVNTAPPTTM